MDSQLDLPPRDQRLFDALKALATEFRDATGIECSVCPPEKSPAVGANAPTHIAFDPRTGTTVPFTGSTLDAHRHFARPCSITRDETGGTTCRIPISVGRQEVAALLLGGFVLVTSDVSDSSAPGLRVPEARFNAAVKLLGAAVDNLCRSHSDLLPVTDGYHRTSESGKATAELPAHAVRRCEKLFDELAAIISYHRLSLQHISKDGRRTLIYGRRIARDTISHWLLRPLSSDPLVKSIVDSRRTFIIADTGTNPPYWGSSPETEDIRSWAGIPIVADDDVSGLITLDHMEAGHFQPEHQAALDDFARRNRSRFEWIFSQYVTWRMARHATIIEHILGALSEPVETDTFLQTIVDQIAINLQCAHCTIFLSEKPEPGPAWLIAKAAHGGRHSTLHRRFQVGAGGLADRVFRTGVAELHDDATADPEFAAATDPSDQPRSMVVAPIRAGETPIGVISADQDGYGWFTEDDLKLIATVGQQAGIPLRRSEAISTLHGITGQMVQLYDKPEHPDGRGLEYQLLRGILDGAIRMTGATTGVIYKVNADKMTVENEYAPDGYAYPQPRISNPDGLTHTVIREKERLVLADVRSDPRPHPLLKKDFASVIVMPLTLIDSDGRKQVIGVLFVDYKDPHQFTPAEIKFLEVLCGQGATAIRNAELIRNLRQFPSVIGGLHALATTAESSGTIDQTIARVGAAIMALLGSGVSPTIDLYDEKAKTFGTCYAFGALRDQIDMTPRENGTGQHVIDHREPLYCPDTRLLGPGLPAIRQELIDLGIVSFAALPLIGSQEVLGVLFVNSTVPLTFDRDTRAILSIFSSHTAIALENARLYEELTRINENLIHYLHLFRHELTSPINYVVTMLPRLHEASADKVREQMWNQVLAQTAEQHAILQNIIGLMRSQSDSRAIAAKPDSLNEVIDDSIALCGPLCESCSVGIRTNTPTAIRLPMDRQMIKRVMINLLNNAIRHSSRGAIVSVTTRKDDQHAIIEVSNLGKPISRRLADRYLRGPIKLPVKRARSGHGLGIGLQVSKFLLDLHGGSIDCDNNSGKGATFRATLPLRRRVIRPGSTSTIHSK